MGLNNCVTNRNEDAIWQLHDICKKFERMYVFDSLHIKM